jgi:hypothetical protein
MEEKMSFSLGVIEFCTKEAKARQKVEKKDEIK